MTEDEFNKNVLKFFQKKLEKTNLPIKVERNNYILRDFTFSRNKKGDWQLLCGTQEQDIIFYKDVIPRKDFLGKIGKTSGTGLRADLIIPIALCELKVGSLNTHGMIVAGKIAQDVKSIFPHCISFFIVSSNIERRLGPETALRQAKSFDGVYLEWEKEKEIIWQELLRHFKYCQERKVF